MFEFRVTSKKNKTTRARTGVFKTPHGDIETPVFMPVGTKATVKTLSSKDLSDLNAEIILANTYHLYLRPGEKIIKKMGGLHQWMNWKKPILTDSGGFQVFSLGEGKSFKKEGEKNIPKQKLSSAKNNFIETTVKIDENGVKFKSHLDGSYHYLTPEKAIQIEHDLGADIIMAFDECAEAKSSKKYFTEAMNRTHNWLTKCIHAHKNYTKKQALFGIVQGGVFKDLRVESAQFINNQNLPGNAIGGLSVGESKEKMYEMVEIVVPHLAENKPRYLMGVGTPEDLLECIDRGIDMFDCVHPTRMARHGAFWDTFGRHSIRNEKYKTDKSPLEKNCQCETCQNYSRSYLRHLIFENEITGLRLMTVHNLHFLLNLMRQIRINIKKGTFPKFKKDFLKKFDSKK